MSIRIFGSGIRRREDPRLITGTATYTDDLTLPRMVHAAMLRSPHAHARIRSIDTSKATAAAGVVAVYTHADTEGALQPTPCAWLVPDSDLKVATYPCIAKDVVRYVGDLVAVVVAEDRYAAEDALELIEVDYEPLPAVIDPEQAAEDGAPQLHDEDQGQPGVPLDRRGWRHRRRLRAGRGRRLRPHHPAAADSERDGDPGGAGQLHHRHRGAGALEHDAEPAYRAVPRFRRVRAGRRQDPGDRAGGGRRVR